MHLLNFLISDEWKFEAKIPHRSGYRRKKDDCIHHGSAWWPRTLPFSGSPSVQIKNLFQNRLSFKYLSKNLHNYRKGSSIENHLTEGIQFYFF